MNCINIGAVRSVRLVTPPLCRLQASTSGPVAVELSNLKTAFLNSLREQTSTADRLRGARLLSRPDCIHSCFSSAQTSINENTLPLEKKMRVWAISDLHADYPDNLRWSVHAGGPKILLTWFVLESQLKRAFCCIGVPTFQ